MPHLPRPDDGTTRGYRAPRSWGPGKVRRRRRPRSPIVGERQRQRKRAAVGAGELEPELATAPTGDVATDVEAETGSSPIARVRRPVERVEDAVAFCGW